MFKGRLIIVRKITIQDFAASSDVQLGQRVALMGMAVKQNGQSFVVGSAGGASSVRFREFIPLITMNMAKATIRNEMIVLRNTP